jgi:hypothetical protein
LCTLSFLRFHSQILSILERGLWVLSVAFQFACTGDGAGTQVGASD